MNESAFGIKTNNRLYFAAGGALALVAVIFVFNFFHPFTANSANAATTDTATTDTTVNLTPNISVTATNINIDTIPETSGSWLTGTSHVTVSTNNATGYKLYVSSSSDQVDLVNGSNSNYKIANLANETTESTFKTSDDLMNHYGFTHDNIGTDTASGQVTAGTYLPLTANNAPKLIKTTTEEQNISETNVTFAAKVDRSIPAGSYENTVTFTAVANDPPAPAMQEFTASDCDKLTPWSYDTSTSTLTEGDTITLKDTRNNQKYQVRKLADDKCWMVENLYLTSGTVLTPELTDMASTTVSHYADDSTTTGTYTIPESVGNPEATSENPVQVDGNNIFSYIREYDMNDGSKTTGSYYSWPVATAGEGSAYGSSTTNNPTASICPKGWKLPTNSQNTSLKNAYNSNRDNFISAYNFTPVGGYYDGYLRSAATSTYWWSRTGYNANKSYRLYVSASAVNTNSNYAKYGGTSVRCVLAE